MKRPCLFAVVVPLLSLASAASAQFAAFVPPPCTFPGPFPDVPDTHPFCAWIQQLANDQVTLGCGGGNYCPGSSVTRGQMAAFLERAMRGTPAWDPYKGVFKRTVLVSPVPGDPAASGTALLGALAGIADSSATNPYLLKIEPGIYQVGSPVVLKAYVDVEGSGEAVTKITGAGSGAFDTGTVVASSIPANAVEVRFLTVENTGGNTYAVAIYSSGSAVKLTNVTATASGGSFSFAVWTRFSSSLVMTDMTLFATGGNEGDGLEEDTGSSSALSNVTATASHYGALLASFGTSIHGSRLKGSIAALLVGPISTVKVSATLLDGGKAGTGSAACVGAFNASYVALGANCQ